MNPDDAQAFLLKRATELKAHYDAHGSESLKGFSHNDLGLLGMLLTQQKKTLEKAVERGTHGQLDQLQHEKIEFAISDVAKDFRGRECEPER